MYLYSTSTSKCKQLIFRIKWDFSRNTPAFLPTRICSVIFLSHLLLQESEMQEKEDLLELRAKELKSQEAVLQAQVLEPALLHCRVLRASVN